MKKYAFLFHCFIWLAIPFILTFITWAYQFTVFLPGNKSFAKSYFTLFSETVVLNSVIIAIGAPAFYLTFNVIFPALLRSPKQVSRALVFLLPVIIWPGLLIIMLSFLSFVVYWSFIYFLLTAYITTIPFMLLGAFAAVFRKWIITGKEMVQLENRNIKTELELLRAQLNPHFLFNTINNIDSLIQKDPATASRYLNELSDILRFMLYETRPERVLLHKEIDYIRKYINLQRMRSVNPGFILFHVNGAMHAQKIAPMIFIPFIENAFKHVANKTEDQAIQLSFDISGEAILFTCINNCKEQKTNGTSNNGLGSHLVRQRLDLLYKDRYELEAGSSNGKYRVKLKIKFNAD